MKEHIGDLNKRVYIDALTSVRNKGAYAEYLQQLQEQIDTSEEPPAFAAGIFDCDNLKEINDVYGHEKGDIYIQSACRLICRVFQHSPVFRIGGDEFAVILQGEDFRNREALLEKFRTEREAICQKEREKWRQVRVTLGIAVYDPSRDHAVTDTFQRADESMYANKRARKEGRQDRFDL